MMLRNLAQEENGVVEVATTAEVTMKVIASLEVMDPRAAIAIELAGSSCQLTLSIADLRITTYCTYWSYNGRYNELSYFHCRLEHTSNIRVLMSPRSVKTR
jgi:hypothetical protein